MSYAIGSSIQSEIERMLADPDAHRITIMHYCSLAYIRERLRKREDVLRNNAHNYFDKEHVK